MNDRLFEIRHQSLMEASHHRPEDAWPENALRALEARALSDLERLEQIREVLGT